MKRTPDFFWSHAVALLAVVVPIARAERDPTYLIAVAVMAALGYLMTVRRVLPAVGPQLGQVSVVAAFALSMVEFSKFGEVLVVALSHFLITYCMIKLLQKRQLRDDVLVQVLCLLLLVVAAIVSGDVMFAVAMIVVLSVALPVFMRVHVHAELDSVSQQVRFKEGAALWRFRPPRIPQASHYRGMAAAVAGTGLVVGAVVFVLCPRLEPRRWQGLETANAGPTLTGLSTSESIAGGGPTRESQRPAMHVKITDANGQLLPYEAGAYYFRGDVSYWYTRRAGGIGGGWGWHCRDFDRLEVQRLTVDQPWRKLAKGNVTGPLAEFTFFLEPQESTLLVAPYPALEISSHELKEFRYDPKTHILRMPTPARVVRYTVASCPPTTGVTSSTTFREPEAPDDASVVAPDPPLPRGEEIVNLIDREVGSNGSAGEPGNRETFLRKLRDYLASDRFTYELSPPRLPPGKEPVGEFLLETRTGNCQHFASAMAIVCHLYGIPARYVRGYHGGEYNFFGGFLVIRDKDAHAWVEAYVPGRGWQVYDPTPSGEAAGRVDESWARLLRVYADFVQFQWGNWVVTFNSGSRREVFDRFQSWLARPVKDETNIIGAVVAFVRELFGGRLQMSPADRLLYWVFALLVLTLAVLVGAVLVTMGRWLLMQLAGWYRGWTRFSTVQREAEFYSRFCRRLDALGLRRQAGQTAAEFAAELAERRPALRDAPRLVRAYYEVVYGRRTLPAETRAWIESFLGQLKRIDRRQGESA